ncbi:MAG TPA: hypothetical protein VND40_05665 [Nitrososphaerales archaeon]|nr:hypothetical protein [Nitrososphaerales archaeon]
MEQMDELRRPDAKTQLMYKVVFGASGFIIFATLAYGIGTSALYASGSIPVIGQNMVNVSWPLPYFTQPVTYLSIAAVTFFYTGLRLWQNKLAQWSHLALASLQLVAIVVAFGAAYALMYNFMLWGSYFSIQLLSSVVPNPNVLASPGSTPWNLVFATKVYMSMLVISGYMVYFLRKVHQVRGLPDTL